MRLLVFLYEIGSLHLGSNLKKKDYINEKTAKPLSL